MSLAGRGRGRQPGCSTPTPHLGCAASPPACQDCQAGKHTENRAAGVVGDRTGSSCTGQCSSPGGPSKGPQLCSRSQRKVAENTGRQFSAGREHRLTARLTRDVQDQLSGRETPSVPSFPPNVQSLSLNSHRDASHLPSTSDRSCPWGQPETRARKHIEGPPLLPTAHPPRQSHRSPGHR